MVDDIEFDHRACPVAIKSFVYAEKRDNAPRSIIEFGKACVYDISRVRRRIRRLSVFHDEQMTSGKDSLLLICVFSMYTCIFVPLNNANINNKESYAMYTLLCYLCLRYFSFSAIYLYYC